MKVLSSKFVLFISIKMKITIMIIITIIINIIIIIIVIIYDCTEQHWPTQQRHSFRFAKFYCRFVDDSFAYCLYQRLGNTQCS